MRPDEPNPALPDTDDPLRRALEDLALGEEGRAEALLGRQVGGAAEADRRALLGFVEYRRGNLEAYRALALEAARIALTPLTLYHLGLSLPPGQGVLALEEAFRRLQGDPGAEARLAYTLAHALRRLGRFREALGYASLAALRRPDPYYRLQELGLELLAGERPLRELEQELTPLAAHEARGVRVFALWLLLWLRRMEGAPARELLDTLLAQLPPASLPFIAPEGILALRGEGDGRPGEAAWRVLRAAGVAAGHSPLHRALVALAEGLLRFPDAAAAPLIEAALPTLERELAEEALRGRAHLAALRGEELPEACRLAADSLRPEARPLFVPASLPQGPYLQVLGGGRLLNGPPVRRRGLELLVLLLARPDGYGGEALAEALYGEAKTAALKVELCRLRQSGILVASRPYRLVSPLAADYLEVREALERKDLSWALALYRGPLLPWSESPEIEGLRAELEEALREAALASENPDHLYALAGHLGDDLGVWESLMNALPTKDPRRPAVLARVRRLRAEYL